MAGPQQLLSLLLQRGDAATPWGFAAAREGRALTVLKVSAGSVGANYLSPGDVILRLAGRDPAEMTQEEVDAVVARPLDSLELLVMKTSSRSRISRTTSSEASPKTALTGTFPRSRVGDSYFQRGGVTRRSSQTALLREMFEQGSKPAPNVFHRQASLGPADKPITVNGVWRHNSYDQETALPKSQTTPPKKVNGTLPRGFWLNDFEERISISENDDKHIRFIDQDNSSDADSEVFVASPTKIKEQDDCDGTQVEIPWRKNRNLNHEAPALGVPKTKPNDGRGRRISPVAAASDDDGTPAPVVLQRTRSRKSLHEIFGVDPPTGDVTRRQSSQISGGDSPSPGPGTPAGDGVTAPAPPPPPPPSFTAPAPPAPPPPPPLSCGALPSVRLSTEIPESRGRDPPAAIQNAMMTKDKKPFTYTPGGLDLSQIRSPRMQRRITRNANSEGVPEQQAIPKTSPLTQGQLPPSALAAMQPQMPVAVFPTGGQQMSPPIPPPQPQKMQAQPPQQQKMPAPPPQPQPQPAPQKVTTQPQQSPPVQAHPQKVAAPSQPQQQRAPASSQVRPQAQNEPGSIYVPPVTQPQSGRAQVGSIYIPPIQQQEQEQQRTASPLSPVLNKAPTPWMSQRPQQQQVPAWANREDSPVQKQTPAPAGTRIIPIHVEGRDPPVQTNKATPSVTAEQQNTRIIPIQLEGEVAPNQPKQSPQHIQQRQPVYVHNKFSPSASPTSPNPQNTGATENVIGHNPRQLQQQQSWGPPGANGAPIQSRSFRVLQKITDTDNTDGAGENNQQPDYPYGNQSTQGVPVHELRKLQLSEDDRALMNKFKAQVDEDSFLHNESDPRYRGPAIPSRAFRMLQSMTDGGSGSDFVPPAPGPARGPQPRPSAVQPATEPSQPYIPPSEQQVQEPKKYTGGCIPSRSFRMLQAMTAPENCGPGQSDM